MKGIIRCAATVFGNFGDYQIDGKNIIEIITALKDYELVPNVIKEIHLEIKEDGIPIQKVVDRFILNSVSRKISIQILLDRLVIEAQPFIDAETKVAIIDIEETLTYAKDVFAKLLEIMRINGKRISLVTLYLSEQSQLSESINNVSFNTFYNGKNVFEWAIRQAIREEVSISGNTEEINIISNMFRNKTIVSSALPTPANYNVDGVIHEIDINTIPENYTNRIDVEFFNEFYNIALQKKLEIERGISGYAE